MNHKKLLQLQSNIIQFLGSTIQSQQKYKRLDSVKTLICSYLFLWERYVTFNEYKMNIILRKSLLF